MGIMFLLFSAIVEFFRKIDRRIKVLYTFIGVHLAHQQLSSQYTQLYATALGASPVELGTLNSIARLTGSVMSIPSGWLADKYGAKKVLLIGLGLTAIIAAIYGLAGNWWILIPAILLFGTGGRLIMPYVDILFINYGGAKNKSLIISISRTLWAMPRIFAPMIAAVIIAHFGGLTAENAAESIRPIYFIQVVLAILVFISIAFLVKAPKGDSVEKTVEQGKKGGGFIQDFRDVFKGEIGLKRWLAMSVVRNIGMSTAMAFIPLWMVNEKKADPYVLGLTAAVGMATAMLLQIPVGKLSDKIGRKKTVLMLRPFQLIANLLVIVAPSPEYLILAGFLGGSVFGGGEGAGIGGISFIPQITMQHELVPAEKRGRWMGILGLSGILTFPASIFGGILWQQGLMIPVLLLPIILEALIVIPILITIPETLGRTSMR